MPSKKSPRSVSLELGAGIVASVDSEFHAASDRAFAVLGAAYMDELLEELLRATFIEDAEATERLLGMTGPIGSNGARYNLAYSLALISKEERDDLKTIARIRNRFAHEYSAVGFDDDDEVRALVRKMHFVKRRAALQQGLVADAKTREAAASIASLKASSRELFRDAIIEFLVLVLPRVRDVRRAKVQVWFGSSESDDAS